MPRKNSGVAYSTIVPERRDPVEPAAASPSGSNADPQPDDDGQHGRDADEQQRVGECRRGSRPSTGRVESKLAAEIERSVWVMYLHELLPLAAIETEPIDEGRALLLAQLAAASVLRQRIPVDDPEQEEVEHQHASPAGRTAPISFLTSRRTFIRRLLAVVVASLRRARSHNPAPPMPRQPRRRRRYQAGVSATARRRHRRRQREIRG